MAVRARPVAHAGPLPEISAGDPALAWVAPCHEIRVIAAANRDPRTAMERGTLREDL